MADKKMTDIEIDKLAEMVAEKVIEKLAMIDAEQAEAEAEKADAKKAEAEKAEAEKAEAEKINFVKMKNDKGIIADVHPDEVENFKNGNYVKV